jgi:hypothetical protein
MASVTAIPNQESVLITSVRNESVSSSLRVLSENFPHTKGSLSPIVIAFIP